MPLVWKSSVMRLLASLFSETAMVTESRRLGLARN